MPWYFFALLAPALFGATNYIEKYVLDKHIDDPATVMTLSCFINGLLGLFLFTFFSNLRVVSWDKAILLVISGALMVIYILPYLKALTLEDASFIAPLFQLIVVFTFLLGAIFLKEFLTFKQLIGLVIVVFAGLLLGNDKISKILKPRKAFWLMVLSCFLISMVLIIMKDSSNVYGFWTSMTYNLLGGGLFGLVLFCLPYVRRKIKKVNLRKVGLLLLIDDIVDMGARLSYFYAQTFVLVALAETLRSTQIFFVLIYGIILTLMFPKIIKEDISWKVVKNKLLVGAIMFVGMWLIYF